MRGSRYCPKHASARNSADVAAHPVSSPRLRTSMAVSYERSTTNTSSAQFTATTILRWSSSYLSILTSE
jgi:hypothetical protein